MTYTLSIETDAGTYQHGYHLGTIENVARDMAGYIYGRFTPRIGTRIVTVALMLDGRMVDCFDGHWFDDEYCEGGGDDEPGLMQQIESLKDKQQC